MDSSDPFISRRVLSIQSSVVAGHVGNKSAVFPMQLLGFEVDVLNTVQFSNHTGYGDWGGDKMTPQHLHSCFDALDRNGLLRHTHLLSGYTPGAEALEVVESIVKRLRETYPGLTYVLDPVMGDDGELYVAEFVPPVYRRLLRHATCATPNDFEASLLTSIPLTSFSSLSVCLSAFHDLFGLPHVIISSATVNSAEARAAVGEEHDGLEWPDADEKGEILMCAGSSREAAESEARQWVIPFPKMAEHFEGVGDLFSSLILARFPSSTSNSDHVTSTSVPTPLSATAELAIASLQSVLRVTRTRALSLLSSSSSGDTYNDALIPRLDESREQRVRRLRVVELRLADLESRSGLERPIVRWKARALKVERREK